MVSQLGMLKGTVASGSVTLNADGVTAAVNSIVLQVNGGTVIYSEIHGGSGLVNATDLQHLQNSSGDISLTF